LKTILLNDTLKLFKTKTNLLNEIEVNFDFFSVVQRPERPLRLIKYDPDKKIIYIPIVLENGKVTDRYILYQFKGQYFEQILTTKEKTSYGNEVTPSTRARLQMRIERVNESAFAG